MTTAARPADRAAITWTSSPMTATGEAVAAWVADRLRTDLAPWLPGPAEGSAIGLYVSTPDAGSGEALAFWRAAHETGLHLAAPGAFPWTLANSPAGRISRTLGVTGPCTTYVGDDDAVSEARLTAELDLLDGLVDTALVVDIRGEQPPDAAGSPVRVRLTAELVRRE